MRKNSNPLRYENMFPNRNIKYTRHGDLDLRCQAGRDFKRMSDQWDELDLETQQRQQQILDDWEKLDPVEKSAHVLSNSDTYRLKEYAKNTAIEEQEYYINREGNLTTWSLDPTVTKQGLGNFVFTPKAQQLVDYIRACSKSLVADKLI